MTNESKVLDFIAALDRKILTPASIVGWIVVSILMLIWIAHLLLLSFEYREFDYYTADNYSKADRVLFHMMKSVELGQTTHSHICSQSDLAFLRQIQRQYYHIGYIARIKNNKIICTTVEGILPQPITLPKTVHNPSTKMNYGNHYSHMFSKEDGRPFITQGNTAAFASDVFLLEFDYGGTRIKGFGAIIHTGNKLIQDPDLGNIPFIFRFFSYVLSNNLQLVLEHQNSWFDYLPLAGNIMTKQRCNIYLDLCVTTVATDLGLFKTSPMFIFVLCCVGAISGVGLAYVVNFYRSGPIAFTRHLKHAIYRGNITPVYQPQIHFKTMRVSGIEALARWRNEQYDRFIPPDIFIPIAESEQLIGPLTKRFIQQVLRETHQQLKKNPHFCVSINISATILIKDDFMIFLKEETEKYQCSPRQIVLEITERSAEDNELMAKASSQASALGFQVSLDDFGTGFSNLEWLSIIRPQEIKIDKVFTQSINTDSLKNVTLHGMLHMIEHLPMRTIFEGIETEEQFKLIRDRLPDCYGQGWLFSKPVPIDNLEERIKEINNTLPEPLHKTVFPFPSK